METSILKTVKKILGLAADYTAFDLDIMVHINSAFSGLTRLGVGPVDGFAIEDDTASWDDYGVPKKQLNLVKTYVYLKSRMLFDPSTSRFLIAAFEKQLAEYEFTLNSFREELIPIPERKPDVVYVDIFSGIEVMP